MLNNIEDDSSYKFGKAHRIQQSQESLAQNPSIYKAFGQPGIYELAKKYLNNDIQPYKNSFQRYNIHPDVVEMFLFSNNLFI